MTDTVETQIIETATLMLRLWHMEHEDEELEQADLAVQAALSQLAPENSGVVMMVCKLLDGKPYAITSNTSAYIQLCIALAHKIGATVEDDDGGFVADAIPRGMRSIRVYPPSQAKQ